MTGCKRDSLRTERAQTFVDRLDLDGVQGDVVRPSHSVVAHVVDALQPCRLRVYDDRVHILEIHHVYRDVVRQSFSFKNKAQQLLHFNYSLTAVLHSKASGE